MTAVGIRKDLLNLLLADLIESGAGKFAEAKLEALSDALDAVIEASIAQCEGLPQTSASALGPQMNNRFERMKRRFANLDGAMEEALDMLAPRFLVFFTARQPSQKENAMPMQRYSEGRDRDERGRFVPEDERERWRGGYRGGPERDEQGRFMGENGHRSWYEDDDEGYRRPMNRSRGYEEDERYSGRDEGRGHRGWFGDPEGHSEASRRGWQSSEHGDSGWYGDREGHSEAARRGWEGGHESVSRSRSRYEDDDRRGYESQRGGRYENDDDYGRGRNGRRGWSGDPEGHSEASRRGWEHRR